jgi:curved DNA-binding protein
MDHYSVLGVTKTATPDEIKKAYRKLASQHHPDKGGDTSKFQRIQEAYAVLSDPEKKSQYDNPRPQGFPPGFDFNMNGDINDIFSQIFRNPRHPNSHKQMMRATVSVGLRDAYTGCNQVLKIQTHFGLKVIDIKVPPGVQSGDQMRYDNVIEHGILIVEFNVLPDLRFDRKGQDLYSNQSISVLDLIAGTNFEFETLAGKKVNVSVKPKTQPFMQLRLSGHGMPIYDSGKFGDQLILIKPYIPDNISDEIVDAILRNRGY